MKKGKLIFGSLILFLLIGIIEGKESLISLAGYEEECLEYKYIEKVYYERTCLYYTFNGVVERRKCYEIPEESEYRKHKQERIVEKVKTNECLKWHLVRFEKSAG